MKTYEYTIIQAHTFRCEAETVALAATQALNHAGRTGRVLSVVQIIPPLPPDADDPTPLQPKPPTGSPSGTPTNIAPVQPDLIAVAA